MTNTSPSHTLEQTTCLDAFASTDPAFHNLIIEARAGSGKTFILAKGVPLLRGSVLALAYNKSIATELQGRINLTFEQQLTSAICTAHSHGLSAFRKAKLRPRTFGGKLSTLLKERILKGKDNQHPLVRNKRIIRQLASLAKNYGFGLVSTSPTEHFPSIEGEEGWLTLWDHFDMAGQIIGDGISPATLINHARELLLLSNAQQDVIDFDDMIYLPLLLNLPIPTYDNVLVDEAQDLNDTRRELIFRSVNPAGRIIAVGDPYQAIYGFTGANMQSLALIGKRAQAATLNLTTCFRCATEVIASTQHLVPDIKARDNAPEGEVYHTTLAAMLDEGLDLPQSGDAILCRLNKPNVFLALRLIAKGHRARIEGRDLGRRLEELCRTADPAADANTLVSVRQSLLDWFLAEESRLVASEKPRAAAMLADEVECAMLLIDKARASGGTAFSSFLAEIEALFGDDIEGKHTIVLSSIHKAKGREWKRVYILGIPDYLPFHLAEAEWEEEAERNLEYVARTRAEETLVLVRDVKRYIDDAQGTDRFEQVEEED